MGQFWRALRMLNLQTQKLKTGTDVIDSHILSASFSLKSTLKALGNDGPPLCGKPLLISGPQQT